MKFSLKRSAKKPNKKEGGKQEPPHATALSKKDMAAMFEKLSSHTEEESIAIQTFDALMVYAESLRTSDVHLEPLAESAIVRFRIDGILHDEFVLPSEVHTQLIARLKIMTEMRTDQHRAPQDGRLSFIGTQGTVDVRASVISVVYGEKAVLRLLSSQSHSLTLEQLGFSEGDLKRVADSVAKPWGMILATGPTGSGKTTSIYAVLEQLNQREVNISTIEDPVEFKIKGINQSQVDRAVDFTFATGLRSLLRQDPDTIMVGEIRDTETAKIAVNAAMTGHKMLSTLHTNDAATAIPRLIDMGVESFLVASTLNCAIAQRLMRRVCADCAGSKKLTKAQGKEIFSDEIANLLFKKSAGITVAEAKGCTKCNETGYKGRVGIFEVLPNSPAIQKLIVEKAESSEIKALAIKEGMTTMEEDGVQKILNKETTIEEFVRVLQE